MPIFIMEIQKLVNKKENKDIFESKKIKNKSLIKDKQFVR